MDGASRRRWQSSAASSSSWSAAKESDMPSPSTSRGRDSGDDRRPPLSVMALREKIVAKIQENRVTLIVGDTGCGKSSQIPQFLLEDNIEPILCTQPRRFAVVAIARMVAKARNCDIGGEVGYHIGHSNVSNIGSRSRIVFKTAGVVLEQIRDKGLEALKYKVIILDEVHERSVESDLLLACVKQFMMKNNDMRVVLMSATADITRYKDYFKDLGRGERVEVIAIPTAPQHVIFERKVLYLEQVADLFGIDSESLSGTYCPSYSDADMSPEIHSLIFKLVLHLHKNEPNIEKSILVFLPTYYSLEQLWILLGPYSLFFKIHVLHRSIDIDQALLAMGVCRSHRKVILATNIAESSVTIPGVAYVVDSCRSLQIVWDFNRKLDSSELVWVSKSQADQRRGRTGRTCDGRIYRLVTRSFYNGLDDHEYPAILRLSLRQQVLMICCSESKAINDPKVLLQRVLDPPDPDIVEDALSFLIQIRALEKSPHRGRYDATFYGRLLDSLPLSLDASILTLKFGEIGLLREGIVIGILMDVQPLPILQPFGRQALFEHFVDNYFESDNSSTLLMGKKEIIFMGNLCAFQFWQRIFKDKIHLERLKQLVKGDEPKVSQTVVTKLEEEWCLSHNLVQTSLHNVSEIYEDIMSVIHCFRPSFMDKVESPCYLEPYTFQHICVMQTEPQTNLNAPLLEENLDSASLRRTCISVPYVFSDDFQASTVAESLKDIIKEIRVRHSQKASIDRGAAVNDVGLKLEESPLCRYFANGLCNRGDQCTFSHSPQAKRPICKFFLTLQGCRNGDACFFSHDNEPNLASFAVSRHTFEENTNALAYNFLRLLPSSANGRVVILNDNNLILSTNLSQHYDPRKIIATTPCTYSQSGSSLVGAKVLWNVTRPCHEIIENKDFLPWRQVKCILWFDNIEEIDLSGHHLFLQNLFEFLAIRMIVESFYDVNVILTMNNIKFSQLQVERLARESFFYLTESFPFDESTFGKVSCITAFARPKQFNATVSYIFSMVRPTSKEFTNYPPIFRRALRQQ